MKVIFAHTGKPDKINQFVILMAPWGAERLREALATLRLVEVSQPTLGRLRKLAHTGICAIARGSEEM